LKANKLKIEIFFPFGSCACTYSFLMEKVGRVTSSLKDIVDVQMRSTSSKEAKQYSIQDCCIVVNGVERLPADFDEKLLEQAIFRQSKQ